MADGIEGHVVSLTKNGYHKVVPLIVAHPTNELLDNVERDRAQTVKILAGNPANEQLPEVWDEVRTRDISDVYALFFISCIFSHKDLIRAFAASKTTELRGVIKRSELGEKAYTNLAFAMKEAGFIPNFQTGKPELIYDLSPIVLNKEIGPMAKKVIRGQLERMGWKAPNEGDRWKRTFYEQCFAEGYEFHKTLGITKAQFKDWLDGEQVELEAPLPLKELSGPVEVSARLVSALSAKRFCILAGSTGTGKTQTALRLASELNPMSDINKDFNLVFIPVGAGWTDARHLLGFKNPFGQEGASYEATSLIRLLLKANYSEYEKCPFFVILDEMNLSYVELYFSKFLSMMESSVDGDMEPIMSVNEMQLMQVSGGLSAIEMAFVDAAIKKGGLFLSRNVFILGTVNIDETTHAFSPKVLDRAFVMEFLPSKPSEVGHEFSIAEEDRLNGEAKLLAELLLKDDHDGDCSTVDAFLDQVFERLGRFKFGPRLTSETRRYWLVTVAMKAIFNSLPHSVETEGAVLDNILFHKVLPKLHGNKKQLALLLDDLGEIAEKNDLALSSQKIAAMKSDLISVGFANYFSMQ